MAKTLYQTNQDPITARLERCLRWAINNWQHVGLIIGAFSLVVVLMLFLVFNLKRLKYQAWDKFSQAQAQFIQGDVDNSLKTLDDLLRNQKSGELSIQASLFKAEVHRKQDEKEKAIDTYKSAVRQVQKKRLKALALSGLALAYEESEKWEESEMAYSKFIDEFSEHFLAARALQGLGRVQLMQQKWKDAQVTYERIVTLFPSTVWANNAKSYLQEIARKIP